MKFPKEMARARKMPVGLFTAKLIKTADGTNTILAIGKPNVALESLMRAVNQRISEFYHSQGYNYIDNNPTFLEAREQIIYGSACNGTKSTDILKVLETQTEIRPLLYNAYKDTFEAPAQFLYKRARHSIEKAVVAFQPISETARLADDAKAFYEYLPMKYKV